MSLRSQALRRLPIDKKSLLGSPVSVAIRVATPVDVLIAKIAMSELANGIEVSPATDFHRRRLLPESAALQWTGHLDNIALGFAFD